MRALTLSLPILSLPILSLGLTFAMLSGCDGGKADDTAGITDEADADGDTDSDTDADTDAERTLDNCSGSVDSDAPAFFQTYFKCATITYEDGTVTLSILDLPPHRSPYYDPDSPNYEPFDDRGGTHFQNPNTLSQQAISMDFPMSATAKGIDIDRLVDQQAGTSDEEYHSMGTPGMNLDGTAMFHGVAAPGDLLSEERYTFDTWEGHPQNTGVYHHHSANPAALAVLEKIGAVSSAVPGEAEIEVYGVMCDGTVLLGCTELDGSAPSGDVDAQGGHVHDITDADGTTHFTDRYHTHMCDGFYGYAPEIAYYNTRCL